MLPPGAAFSWMLLPANSYPLPPLPPLDFDYSPPRVDVPLDLSVRNTSRHLTPPPPKRAFYRPAHTTLPPYLPGPSSEAPQGAVTIVRPNESLRYDEYRRRPFRVFANNPLMPPFGLLTSDSIKNSEFAEEFDGFLSRLPHQTPSRPKSTNVNMRRSAPIQNSAQQNDPMYRAKRDSNNRAAKKSRDARNANYKSTEQVLAFFQFKYIEQARDIKVYQIKIVELKRMLRI